MKLEWCKELQIIWVLTTRFILSLCSSLLLSLLGWMMNEYLLDELWTSLYSQEGQNTICQVAQSLQSLKKENSVNFSIANAVALSLWKIRLTRSGKLVDRITLSWIPSFPKVIIFLIFAPFWLFSSISFQNDLKH